MKFVFKKKGFFVRFFILFKIIYNRKTYFIVYNLQTNKQTNKKTPSTTHFTRAFDYWKPNPFAYSLVLTLLPNTLPPTDSKAESGKMSKSFGLQNIFNLLPFSLVHSMSFFIVYWIFLYVFKLFIEFFPLCFWS